jgi:hypothetical protein
MRTPYVAVSYGWGVWVCGPCFISMQAGGTYRATLGNGWAGSFDNLGTAVEAINRMLGKNGEWT